MNALLQQLKKIFKKNSHVLAVYLIGSYANKTVKPDSDFDLVVIVDNSKTVDFDQIYTSIQHLKFPKNLDLSVIDHNSSPLFLFETVSRGIKIYERNIHENANYEAGVLHRYYDTQHIRNIYYSYLKNKFV
jgi:predicted nucleotidyltransferase